MADAKGSPQENGNGELIDELKNAAGNVVGGLLNFGLKTLDRGFETLNLALMSSDFKEISRAQKRLDEYTRQPISASNILLDDADTSMNLNRISFQLNLMNEALLRIHTSGIRFNSAMLAAPKEKISRYLKQFDDKYYRYYDSSTDWLRKRAEKSDIVKKAIGCTPLDEQIDMATRLKDVKSGLTNVNNTLTALTDSTLPATQRSNNPILSAILTDEKGQTDENITVWDILGGVVFQK